MSRTFRWNAVAAIALATVATIAYFAAGPSDKAPQVVERDGMISGRGR